MARWLPGLVAGQEDGTAADALARALERQKVVLARAEEREAEAKRREAEEVQKKEAEEEEERAAARWRAAVEVLVSTFGPDAPAVRAACEAEGRGVDGRTLQRQQQQHQQQQPKQPRPRAAHGRVVPEVVIPERPRRAVSGGKVSPPPVCIFLLIYLLIYYLW